MSYQPLVLCPRCARHVRASERQCPFCGNARSGVANLRGVVVGTVLAATMAGCNPQPETVSPYAPPPVTEADAVDDESVNVIAEPPDGGLSGGPHDVVPVPPYAPVPPVDEPSPVPAYAAVPPVDEP